MSMLQTYLTFIWLLKKTNNIFLFSELNVNIYFKFRPIIAHQEAIQHFVGGGRHFMPYDFISLICPGGEGCSV